MIDKLMAVFSKDKLFLTLLVLTLFLPVFFHGPRFGIPYVKGGDEPHYLAMINSILNDRDLDVRNNYEESWRGSWQIGKKFAGLPIYPHGALNVGGKWVKWWDVFEATEWGKDSEGHPVPLLKPGVAPEVASLPVYPLHPAGMPLLLSFLLWPVRGTLFVEPLALLFANLAVILSVFLFRRVVRRYTQDPRLINLSAFLVFLCTPIWAYGRTLFTEPFLVFFALGAYLAALEKNSGFWAGVLLGLGIFMKPPFAVLIFPLVIFWFIRKEWRNLLALALGPALAVAVYFFINFKIYGVLLFHNPAAELFVNPLVGITGLWFSWNHGILTFSPVILPILLSWKNFLKEQGPEAFLWGGGFLIYFLLMSFFIGWSGYWCFGPRQVVPVIPFLMVPACYALKSFSDWDSWKKWVFVILCVLSFAFNALGAMDGYWHSHPLTLFKGNIS